MTKITIESICNIVCQYLDLTMSQIIPRKGWKGDLKCCYGRHLIMYLCCMHTKESLKDIGEYLKRHHSSVIHGRDHIISEMSIYDEVRHDVEELTKKITGENAQDQADILYSTLFREYTKIKRMYKTNQEQLVIVREENRILRSAIDITRIQNKLVLHD